MDEVRPLVEVSALCFLQSSDNGDWVAERTPCCIYILRHISPKISSRTRGVRKPRGKTTVKIRVRYVTSLNELHNAIHNMNILLQLLANAMIMPKICVLTRSHHAANVGRYLHAILALLCIQQQIK